jgi:hydroxymethylpyrimidine kinase/phosphomethylpyrimidine kinase/thiamine-phosphate diphosphorylase
LQNADLKAIQKAGLRLGISTHGCYEFLLAQQLKPSYLAIGAIFSTKTKNMTGQIQGVENLKHILQLATDIPVVAIGGINHQRAEQVWQTGVDGIAVVTAITESDNAEIAVKQFQHFMPFR